MQIKSGTMRCEHCEFDLWLPIDDLSSSHVGLYSDARFPGRCIVSLNEHAEHLDELPPDTVSSFMLNVAMVSKALKIATESERINIAILGNQETHVHAHLIPRYPANEALPNKAPWEDPRPRQKLDKSEEERLRRLIKRALDQVHAYARLDGSRAVVPERGHREMISLVSSEQD